MINIMTDDKGDFVFKSGEMQAVAGDDELMQNIRELFRTNLGEWFLNPEEGFPYVDFLRDSKINPDLVLEELIYATMDQVDQITAVENLVIDKDTEGRFIRVSMNARKLGGELLEVANLL